MPYRDWLPSQSPAWLRGPNGSAWLEEVGDAGDAEVARVKAAAKVGAPAVAPDDALPYIGAEQQMDQGTFETVALYRARLAAPFAAWQYGGAMFGILTQLRAIGYTSSNGNPVLVQQNGLGFTLDAAGALVKTVLGPNPPVGGIRPLAAGTREWWSFDGGLDANMDQYNSRFGLLFPSLPSGWAPPVTPGLAELNTIRRSVHRWREGAARFMGIWLKTSGVMWGWGMTWAAFNWGGGVEYYGPDEV